MSAPRYLSRDQVRAIDRYAVEQLGIPGVVLMENAGRAVAEAVRELLPPGGKAPVAVAAGRGNNGGDGFVAARHLALAAVPVAVYLLGDPERLPGDARVNFEIISRMGLPVARVNGSSDLMPAADAGVVVDALLGTGLAGPVREPCAGIIRFLNELGRPVVAVDIPSGLDCDTGRPLGTAVRADCTVTFVALKKGFADPESSRYTGRVVVAGIGAPAGVAMNGTRNRRQEPPS